MINIGVKSKFIKVTKKENGMKKLLMGLGLAVLFVGSANLFCDQAADDLAKWLGKISNDNAVMGMGKNVLCNAQKYIDGKTVGYMDAELKKYIDSLKKGDEIDRTITLPMIKNAINDQINKKIKNAGWTACPK